MIRRALGRLFRVAPPGWAVVGFVLFFLLCEGPVWFANWKFGRIDMPNRFGPKVLRAGGFLLGVFRAVAFHPYFRPGYLRWLKATPWTVTRSLPLGPLELVPEDALPLCLLVSLGMTLPDFTSLNIINMFLFGNIITLILTFWKTGASALGYCVLLFLGFIPQMWQRQWVDFAVLSAVYFLVHDGLWRTLCKFPWQTEGFWRDLGFVNAPAGADPNPSCGWSYNRFYRDIHLAKGINRIDALLGCMLLSWWLWSACSLISDHRDRSAVIAMVAIGVILCAPPARLLIYVRGYRPPISFWGRIWTFRWIIPGYDQVFVAPVCSFAGAVMVLFLLSYQMVPVDVCFAIAAGVAALLALISPPRLRRWRLVGEHRMGPNIAEHQASLVAAGR